MTERGSFKRAVRRSARGSGGRYTDALARMRADGDARPQPMVVAEQLAIHLEDAHGIKVESLTQLARHGGWVFRVDRQDGPPWVARVFPNLPVDRVRGDAELLQFLDRHDFPAERVVAEEPVTSGGHPVLVTSFVPGAPGGPSPITAEWEGALGDLLGRLHALPRPTGLADRAGGAFSFGPAYSGRPREDLFDSIAMLEAIKDDVPPARRPFYEELFEAVVDADECDDLPEALTNTRMSANNVIATADGRAVAVDWTSAGRGPRLPALAFLIQGGAGTTRQDVSVIEAIVESYSEHITLEPAELDRLEAAMRIQPLLFACFYLRANVQTGANDGTAERTFAMIEGIASLAEKTIAAFARRYAGGDRRV